MLENNGRKERSWICLTHSARGHADSEYTQNYKLFFVKNKFYTNPDFLSCSKKNVNICDPSLLHKIFS
jgi:hypothetical protein